MSVRFGSTMEEGPRVDYIPVSVNRGEKGKRGSDENPFLPPIRPPVYEPIKPSEVLGRHRTTIRQAVRTWSNSGSDEDTEESGKEYYGRRAQHRRNKIYVKVNRPRLSLSGSTVGTVPAPTSTISSTPTAVASGVGSSIPQYAAIESHNQGMVNGFPGRRRRDISFRRYEEARPTGEETFSPMYDTLETWVIAGTSHDTDGTRGLGTNHITDDVEGRVGGSEEVVAIRLRIPPETIAECIRDLDADELVGGKLMCLTPSELKQIGRLLWEMNAREPDNRFEWFLAQMDGSTSTLRPEGGKPQTGNTTTIYLWRRPRVDIDRVELGRQADLARLKQVETGYQPHAHAVPSGLLTLRDEPFVQPRKPEEIGRRNTQTKTQLPSTVEAEGLKSTTKDLGRPVQPLKPPKFVLNVAKKEPTPYKSPTITSEADEFDAWLTAAEDEDEPAERKVLTRTEHRRSDSPLLEGRALASGTDAQTTFLRTNLRPRRRRDNIARNAELGAEALTIGEQIQRQRSRRREVMRDRSPDRCRNGAELASTALATAAATSLYEKRKVKPEVKDEGQGLRLGTGARSGSRSPQQSLQPNYYDDRMVEYGDGLGLVGRNRDRRELRSRSRNRNKVRDAINGIAAAHTAAIGVMQYKDRPKRSDSETDVRGRSRSRDRDSFLSPDFYERNRNRHYSDDSCIHSPIRASGGSGFTATVLSTSSPAYEVQIPRDTPGSYPLQPITSPTSNGAVQHGTPWTPGTRQGFSNIRNDPIPPSRDKQDYDPRASFSSLPKRHKTIGYSFSLSLILFILVGLFAACIQSIAVYRRHQLHKLPQSVPPTWDDIDLFELLSNNCWLALSLLFSLLLTLKSLSENGEYKQWLWVWVFSFLSLGCCPLSISLYITSTALAQGFSGAGSVLQVLVYFLTIRILEKSDTGAVEKRREELDEWMERYEKRCGVRRQELCDELLALEERLPRREMLNAKDEDIHGRVARARHSLQDEALGSSLAGSGDPEDDDPADRVVSACV